ncbi:hypothetical protein RRG08_062282 [Elysia crispata]|uniref:Uncharacterized protein n=1 Tax=Elysia crispata TaxID=231223 RepID=A0AAE1CYW1_9GAST|nr:hypothetical protein RRG08_062282 [Elysia crispata]
MVVRLKVFGAHRANSIDRTERAVSIFIISKTCGQMGKKETVRVRGYAEERPLPPEAVLTDGREGECIHSFLICHPRYYFYSFLLVSIFKLHSIRISLFGRPWPLLALECERCGKNPARDENIYWSPDHRTKMISNATPGPGLGGEQ